MLRGVLWYNEAGDVFPLHPDRPAQERAVLLGWGTLTDAGAMHARRIMTMQLDDADDETDRHIEAWWRTNGAPD